MRKAVKICILIAILLIVSGVAVFVLAFSSASWDLSKLVTESYETNTYEIGEKFDDISIRIDTADVVFVPSEDGICRVTCYEKEKEKHTVSVLDGTLTVNLVSEKNWYDYIGIGFETPRVTISLPKEQYGKLSVKGDTGDVKIPKELKLESIDVSISTGDVFCSASATQAIEIKVSTGDVRVEDVRARTLSIVASTGKVKVSNVTCEGDALIRVTTGDVVLTDVTCKSLGSTGGTGDLSLKRVLATQAFSLKRSTGDVDLEDCDAAEIFIVTDTGHVKGTLLSEKVFVVETDTGKKDVPNTGSGGRCEITTDTGDIVILVKS